MEERTEGESFEFNLEIIESDDERVEHLFRLFQRTLLPPPCLSLHEFCEGVLKTDEDVSPEWREVIYPRSDGDFDSW